jgi:hypothetical protein
LKSVTDEGDEPTPKKIKKSKLGTESSEDDGIKPVETQLSEEEVQNRRAKHGEVDS